MDHTVLLIHLETGETMSADSSQLRNLGMPDGYRVADSISTEEWIEALQNAIKNQ